MQGKVAVDAMVMAQHHACQAQPVHKFAVGRSSGGRGHGCGGVVKNNKRKREASVVVGPALSMDAMAGYAGARQSDDAYSIAKVAWPACLPILLLF